MSTNTSSGATAMAAWETVIGLEVHARLLTEAKIFCGCSAKYGAPPNSQVCPICLGHPGVLPVLNRRAVDLALRVALAIGARVDRASVFARKNYFYPDLPKGYQISQFDRPLCTGGHLEFTMADETGDEAGRDSGAASPRVSRRVAFQRIHLEEDAGKSLHPERGETVTRIDLNRCGTPLIEMVTAPDLTSPAEAHAFLLRLKQLLLYLEVNDGNMEEGSLRCDANISVRRRGDSALGVKVEIKNLNSFRNVERGLAHEAERQITLLEAGHSVAAETRLWDAARDMTASMRSKEEAHDYRYFPDPDLKPLVIEPAWLDSVAASLPELPPAVETRLENQYGISAYDARVLASSRELASYFEETARFSGDGKLAANWVINEVMRLLKDGEADPWRLRLKPARLGEMLQAITAGTISGRIGKMVFVEMAETGRSAPEIVAEKGLAQISDIAELDRLITDVIQAHPGPVRDYLKGKEASFQFLVGQAMKASRGRAEPKGLRERLEAALRAKKET